MIDFANPLKSFLYIVDGKKDIKRSDITEVMNDAECP